MIVYVMIIIILCFVDFLETLKDLSDHISSKSAHDKIDEITLINFFPGRIWNIIHFVGISAKRVTDKSWNEFFIDMECSFIGHRK